MTDINLDISAGRDRSTPEPIDDRPFRIALLGDWSGRGSREAVESAEKIAARQPHRIDRDDVDHVLESLAPALGLKVGGAPVTIRFSALEDFHPDRLYATLPVFQALRELRDRLKDPKQFPAAAREMAGEAPPPPPPKPAAGGSLLDSILDEASPPDVNAALAASGGDLHAFLQQVLRPHLIPNPDPRQADLVTQVDAAASATLRAILHDPSFQSLEALWRAVDLMVRRVDTSPDLRIELIDISEAELRAAVAPGQDPLQSPLYALLTRQSQSVPWALLVSAFALGGSEDDLERAAQLAAMGHLLKAPWIASAHPRLAGIESFGQTPDASAWQPPANPGWTALRSSQLARSLGLVLPRFLVRMPYGKEFEETESLRFEELEQPTHGDYLWAPGSFAVALIAGRAFAEAGGWDLGRSIDPEIGSLPYVVHGRGADARSIPTAEVPMTERGAEKLMDQGLMVLATLKDQGRLRLVRLQSVASPVAALAGRWT